MNADVRLEELNLLGFLQCALQWIIQIIRTYGIFGVLAALCRVSTGFCNSSVCAGPICYLGLITGYTVPTERRMYLGYAKLWEMVPVSIQKTAVCQESPDLVSIDFTR